MFCFGNPIEAACPLFLAIGTFVRVRFSLSEVGEGAATRACPALTIFIGAGAVYFVLSSGPLGIDSFTEGRPNNESTRHPSVAGAHTHTNAQDARLLIQGEFPDAPPDEISEGGAETGTGTAAPPTARSTKRPRALIYTGDLGR